jgi:hypothetical protein
VTGKCAFGCAERELIVAGGTRQLRVTARESAKPAVTRPWSSRLSTSVDDGKGAGGPERGARSCEGKTLKGGIPGTAAACNKAAKLGWARKPLRG